VLPRLRGQIRSIVQYLGEREREAHYRLEKFRHGRGSIAATARSSGVFQGDTA
jgi:hypothetical protein